MKRVAFLILAVCFSITVKAIGDNVKIEGQFLSLAGKTITITGPDHFYATCNLNNNGWFKTTLNAKQGYYLLKFGTSSTYLYLARGFNFKIIGNDSTLLFQGPDELGAGQNNTVKKLTAVSKNYWHTTDETVPDSLFLTEPVAFIMALDDIRNIATSILKSHPYDDFFLKTQQDYIKYHCKLLTFVYQNNYGRDMNREKAAMALIRGKNFNTPGLAKKFNSAMDSVFVKRLSKDYSLKFGHQIWDDFDFNNEIAFTFCNAYHKLIDIRISRLIYDRYTELPDLENKGQGENSYDVVKKQITNAYIQQYLLHKYMLQIIQSGKDIDDYLKDYLAIATDTVFKNDIKQMSLATADFTFNDTQNNPFTLKSLQGSYVYIDIWATWCVPCINELPSLMQIEKRYEGKNIKFVSLSIDKQINLDKWKKFITDKNLTGLQLIADKDFNSDFTKKFNVDGIPRFILIDPKGKVVSPNADRPSNPSLQALLDKLLTKI